MKVPLRQRNKLARAQKKERFIKNIQKRKDLENSPEETKIEIEIGRLHSQIVNIEYDLKNNLSLKNNKNIVNKLECLKTLRDDLKTKLNNLKNGKSAESTDSKMLVLQSQVNS